MNYYNIAFSYFSILTLIFILFFTGFLIFKRATTERRLQLLLPAGSIFGICLYIFLLNITAHLIKGIPGFLVALSIQIILTFIVIRFIPSSPLTIPRGKEATVWILTIFFWIVFLYQITAHATTNGADSVLHQSFASRFIRGDYPMHTPWQPDYTAYYHYGGAQLLGSFHALTGAPYYFIHPFIAFWMLLSVTQIFTWIIFQKKITLRSALVGSLPAFIGLISLGGFFIVWPVKFQLPSWGELPTFYNALEVYGAPFNLDALVFFLHRFLATSFFISLLVLLLYPKKNLLSFFALTVYLAAIAFTDESVLVVTILPILIISFINIFNRSIKAFAITITIISLIILYQGGLITETYFNRYGDSSNILIFPGNGEALTEKYLDYRLAQQQSKFYHLDEKLKTFNWFHPGIIWQLIFCLILVLILSKKDSDPHLKKLSWILVLSGMISLVTFHGLVPKGYTHPNGNRFLALSYYLSGICLAYLCYFWFSQKINLPKIIKASLNILIVWILLVSLIPPLIQLFPRKKDNWFIIRREVVNPIIKWVEKNIPTDKRIVALTSTEFSNSMNIELVVKAGMLTPMWPPKPRVHDSFDISPTYADLHYTLNSQALKALKIDYILISNSYLSQLPKERQQDLQDTDFFTPIFTSDDRSVIILEIKPKFLSEGENFKGTFAELDQIAPQDGSYCIDYPPNISAHTYRILRLLLYNRRHYCSKGGAFYNARIDVTLDFPRDHPDRYEFLVLGKDVDPKIICNCQAKLLWEGLGNGVKLWQTRY
ncbi:MAG: hypothetical protein AAB414_02500 [Patescibacteria group bacterium]